MKHRKKDTQWFKIYANYKKPYDVRGEVQISACEYIHGIFKSLLKTSAWTVLFFSTVTMFVNIALEFGWNIFQSPYDAIPNLYTTFEMLSIFGKTVFIIWGIGTVVAHTILIIVYVILALGAVKLLYNYTLKHLVDLLLKPFDRPKEEKQPNALMVYLKAKKEKFCPMLTFED